MDSLFADRDCLVRLVETIFIDGDSSEADGDCIH